MDMQEMAKVTTA